MPHSAATAFQSIYRKSDICPEGIEYTAHLVTIGRFDARYQELNRVISCDCGSPTLLWCLISYYGSLTMGTGMQLGVQSRIYEIGTISDFI